MVSPCRHLSLLALRLFGVVVGQSKVLINSGLPQGPSSIFIHMSCVDNKERCDSLQVAPVVCHVCTMTRDFHSAVFACSLCVARLLTPAPRPGPCPVTGSHRAEVEVPSPSGTNALHRSLAPRCGTWPFLEAISLLWCCVCPFTTPPISTSAEV